MVYGYDDYKKEVETFKEQIPQGGNGMHHFLFILRNGRYTDVGQFDSYSEAYDYYTRHCSQYAYKIFPTNTTNIAEAHRRFKRTLLDARKDFDFATQLIQRKPTVDKQESEEDKAEKEAKEMFGY